MAIGQQAVDVPTLEPAGGGFAVEVEVRPPSPFRMPAYGGEDRVMRVDGGVASRLLHVEGSPVLARAWQRRDGRVVVRAETVDPAAVTGPSAMLARPARRSPATAALQARAAAPRGARPAGRPELEVAVARMRFALGVDDDLGEFFRRFRGDQLLGPLLRRRPHLRPQRRPWPWEALAWAVVKQLIESGRAARIQRRIVGRWGTRMGRERDALRDVPPPELIAGRAPAELQAMDLSAGRAIALRAVAREIAAGRCDPSDPAADRRLLAVPEIGPWTIQCLGLFGRGDPDSLPAGDLIFLKLVGRLARLGRRATVPEVEEFFAPYAPFRGLAASWTVGLSRAHPAG
jgi:3-methyladenine DNA glycosylase/8-oxoguanine DNA glycosylase